MAEAFPDLGDTIYMNTASLAVGCAAAVEAFRTAADDWGRGRFDWVEGEHAAEDDRRSFAALVGAPPQTIAIIPTVSGVAGLVAAHVARHRPGGNVVVAAGEFTSNLFPWRQLEGRDLEVRLVDMSDGTAPVESFAELADADTRLIAVSAVQSAGGYRVDLGEMSELADRCGSLLFVDASQMAGALPIDVGASSIDVLAAPGHKFLLGSRGMGYGYISPGLRDAMDPIFPGWAAADQPLSSFYGPDMDLSVTASRFDMSTIWFSALADRCSFRLLEHLGSDLIHRHNEQLASHMHSALAEAGIPFLDHGPRHSSTIFSVDPAIDDARERLAAVGAIASVRAGRVRLSLHLYNTIDQIDAVVDTLAR